MPDGAVVPNCAIFSLCTLLESVSVILVIVLIHCNAPYRKNDMYMWMSQKITIWLISITCLGMFLGCASTLEDRFATQTDADLFEGLVSHVGFVAGAVDPGLDHPWRSVSVADVLAVRAPLVTDASETRFDVTVLELTASEHAGGVLTGCLLQLGADAERGRTLPRPVRVLLLEDGVFGGGQLELATTAPLRVTRRSRGG